MEYDWNLPKQTILYDPDIPKVAGDCWRCCVAAILQAPAETVPHFLQQAIDSEQQNEDRITQQWLNERGMWLLSGNGHGDYGMYFIGDKSKAPPLIACGPTRRSRRKGAHHAVVMLGEKMVYDPHPDDTGLLYIVDWYAIVCPANRGKNTD